MLEIETGGNLAYIHEYNTYLTLQKIFSVLTPATSVTVTVKVGVLNKINVRH